MKRPIHIYGLTDPAGLVWYVGASGHPSLRLLQHRSKNAAKRVREWVASLGIKPSKTILETCPLGDWRERERYWIGVHRLQNPQLLNTLDGGNGLATDNHKERFNVYLPPSLKAALDKRHAETGVPTAVFVRLCIEVGLTPAVSTLINKTQKSKAGTK